MNNTYTYLSPESQARAEAALAFDNSEARRAWSSQRISNSHDDIVASLESGIERIKKEGSQTLRHLCQADLLSSPVNNHFV